MFQVSEWFQDCYKRWNVKHGTWNMEHGTLKLGTWNLELFIDFGIISSLSYRMFIYQVLNVFFMILHPAIIIFNLFGWIWKKTRLANLILLLLTGGSWFILGIFYGIGYCPITQWHWEVLQHLGKTNVPESYVKYLAEKVTGISFSNHLVDIVTATCYFAALVLSLYVNLRKKKHG